MKRILYLIVEFAVVAACAACMVLHLTPRGDAPETASEAAAGLMGSYSRNHTYIWMAEYEKNLLGSHAQQLDLFEDGTYVLSMHYACISNMDTDIVQGATFDPFFTSRLTLTGRYETVSEPDDLGIMEIRLTSAEVKAVSGNFWAQETDGVRNFTVTAAGTTVTVDVNTLSLETSIPMFAVNEEPAA